MPVNKSGKKQFIPKTIKTEEQVAAEQLSKLSKTGIDKGRILSQWSFPEYERPERGLLWYIVALGSSVGLLIYAIVTANLLFALIILLLGIIFFTHHRSAPLELMCTIFQTGIQVGDRFFLWREVESFWIIYEPPAVKRLYIAPKGALLRHEISIPLQRKNPLQIRALLLDYIKENLDKEEESLSDTAARVLKL